MTSSRSTPLCDCTAIDTSRRGFNCIVCGKHVLTKDEEAWLKSLVRITPEGARHEQA